MQTKLGVIGPGLIWTTTHLPVIRTMPGAFSVTAVAARSEESRRKAGGDCPGAKLYADYRDLIADPNVDAVVATTPIALNGPITLAALDAGKPVFVEKPLAASTEITRQIVEKETSGGGGRVFILEQLLYTNLWDRIKALFGGEEIGTVAMFDRVSHGYIGTDIDPYFYGRTSWRVNGEFPLGPLFDGGVHEIALFQHLFGIPQTVSATGQNFRPEHGEFDVVNALIEYDSGVVGVLSHSGMLGGGRSYFNIRGTRGLIHVGDVVAVEPRVGDGKRNLDFDPGTFWGSLHAAMWRTFAELLTSNQPPPYTAAMAHRDIALLLAIEKSIKTGKKTNVEA